MQEEPTSLKHRNAPGWRFIIIYQLLNTETQSAIKSQEKTSGRAQGYSKVLCVGSIHLVYLFVCDEHQLCYDGQIRLGQVEDESEADLPIVPEFCSIKQYFWTSLGLTVRTGPSATCEQHPVCVKHGYLYYTLYFLAYFGDMFFSLFSIIWGHSVAASCWSWSEFQWPKFEVGLWYCYRTFGISGINLCHLGAELSILRCRKCFRGQLPLKKIAFCCC
jgi:hypothetical protein